MIINNLGDKAWKLLQTEATVFKNWEQVSYEMQDTYKKKYTQSVYQNHDMVSLELSQSESSDWGYIIDEMMYPIDDLLEMRGGYCSNGMMNTFHIRDTKPNIVSWLSLVNQNAESYKDENMKEQTTKFIIEILKSLEIASYSKTVKVPQQSQVQNEVETV